MTSNEQSGIKRVVLCADDYAANALVSKGIRQLLAADRLSAVSCMTNTPSWSSDAAALVKMDLNKDVGLHLNLSEHQPITSARTLMKDEQFISFPKLLIKELFGQLDYNEVKAEIRAQVISFQQHYHRWPDFIDGHRHCHHLRTVSNALVDVYNELFPNKNVYIRLASNGWLKSMVDMHAFPKALTITFIGAMNLKKCLVKYNIPHNHSFQGLYRFQGLVNYERHFQRFITRINNNGIIMCHPGLSFGSEDQIGRYRENELSFLQSQSCLENLQRHNVGFSRFQLK